MARIDLAEGAAPSTPAAGLVALYAKTDGLLYSKDDAGAETALVGTSTFPIEANLRITLTPGTPVTTADVTAGTSIYITPYKGNRVTLWSGSAWVPRTFTEITVAVPSTTDTGYDVFLYDNAGVVTAELLAWTNLTTRVALTTQNGALARASNTTRLFIGSFRTTGVSGQTEDSEAKRFVSSYHHPKERVLFKNSSTNSQAYVTAAYRAYLNETTFRVEVFVCYQENPVSVDFLGITDGSATTAGSVGIGVDSATVNSARVYARQGAGSTFTAGEVGARYKGFPGVGHHYFQPLEYATGGSVNFYGDNNVTTMQAGIDGIVWG